MSGRGKPPPQPKRAPAKGAGRTVEWGRGAEEFLLPVSKLAGAHQAETSVSCGRCETHLPKGSWVFREEGRLVGVNCCGTMEDVKEAERDGRDPVPLGDLTDAEDVEGRDFVPLSQVMPSNRSKADMCSRCFQIPSASGECGC